MANNVLVGEESITNECESSAPALDGSSDDSPTTHSIQQVSRYLAS